MMASDDSLQGKLKQVSVRARVRDLLAGRPIGPWAVELDPTTACNLACHDCISANLINQGSFERGRIKDLARELQEIGVRAVVLIGGGEPMAHPEFSALVEYFHDHDVHVGITTNGTLIHRHLDLLAEKTRWVRVSVDAGSDETFREYRPAPSGRSLFSTVIEGMRELGRRKKCRFGYSFLVLSKRDEEGNTIASNASDIARAARLAKDLGCDYFEVKPCFDLLHYLVDHSPEVNDTVHAQLESVMHLQDATFRIISPYTLNEALDGVTTQHKDYRRCLVSELRTVVSPSGVYVCPYHRGNLNMRIGDATRQTISQIWTGPKRKTVMRRVNPSIHCAFHCIRHMSNQLLEQWAAAGMTGEELADYDRFI